MHGGVVNENTPLLHHLLDMAQAQRVGNIPAHANQHHFQRVVEPLENFAQGAIDQTFTEIMHGSDCPTSLLRHNLSHDNIATSNADAANATGSRSRSLARERVSFIT